MMNQDQPPSDAQHPDSSSSREYKAKPDQTEQNHTEQQQSKLKNLKTKDS
jgi:HlyD family secretion protein